MAALDAKFVALAIDLLDRLGVTVTITTKDGGSAFDPATGTRSTGSDTALTATIVPPSIERSLVRDGHGESNIVTYVSPSDLLGNDIKFCDKITMPNSKIYSIIERTEIYSGDEIALIRLELE